MSNTLKNSLIAGSLIAVALTGAANAGDISDRGAYIGAVGHHEGGHAQDPCNSGCSVAALIQEATLDQVRPAGAGLGQNIGGDRRRRRCGWRYGQLYDFWSGFRAV
mgnify:CR=1 FL=1